MSGMRLPHKTAQIQCCAGIKFSGAPRHRVLDPGDEVRPGNEPTATRLAASYDACQLRSGQTCERRQLASRSRKDEIALMKRASSHVVQRDQIACIYLQYQVVT